MNTLNHSREENRVLLGATDVVRDRNMHRPWDSRHPGLTLRLEILAHRFHRRSTGRSIGHVEDDLPGFILAREPNHKTPGIRLNSVEQVPNHLNGRGSDEDTCLWRHP